MNNPLGIIQAIQNPQQFVENMMNNSQAMQNPMVSNAVNLARNGDKNGLQRIAENLCKTNGKDFDTEFQQFKKRMNL